MSFLSSLFPPSIGPEEAADALSERTVTALDVRERHEWKAGHIARAKHMPLRALDARVGELDAGVRYVAVCRSGSRSARATAHLRKAGFDVVNLKGGLAAWRRAGLPLEPRNGRVV